MKASFPESIRQLTPSHKENSASEGRSNGVLIKVSKRILGRQKNWKYSLTRFVFIPLKPSRRTIMARKLALEVRIVPETNEITTRM
jgi:hypothetical protein